jgi:hypothetical protein
MFDWGDETYTQWHSLNNSVGILTETHQWTTPGTYSICVQYRNEFFDEGIWSEPLIVTITDCTIDDLPQIPEPPQGITRGCTNQPYTFSTQTTDPSGILIQYRIKWNIHTISNWTSYAPSGTPRELTHIWQKPGEYTLYSQARNQYGLISNWSTPVSLTIQLDTDEDHVPDTIENQYGSNYSDPTDITLIQLNNHEHFLILTEITPYFYNTTQQNASMIRTLEPGKLLLDDNLDGKWDYLYNKLKGTLTTYNPLPINTEFILLTLVILASITTIILILVILIKKGYIYLYEEYVTDE